MKRELGRLLATTLCMGLAACNTPRGAGFESEVLSVSASEDAAEADFAVVPVTKTNQSVLAGWPAVGGDSHRWIRRAEQPNSAIIAAGDVVKITVWDAEENSLLAGPGGRVAKLDDVTVSSGGRIFLPFVGDLNVRGMSPETARERIEEEYARSIPSAQVQVTVEQGRANTANLVGGVNEPGTYPLVDRDVTLLSLIAQGGGVRDAYKNPQVRLFRGGEVYAISLDRLYDDPDLDTTLVGGDRIIVEDDERTFLSLGATGSEAVHQFEKDEVSALEALSIVGGVEQDRANPKGILILREYPSRAVRADGSGPEKSRVVFTLDLTSADGLFSARNFKIMPDDLVYATESPVTSARTILGLLGTALGVANRL